MKYVILVWAVLGGATPLTTIGKSPVSWPTKVQCEVVMKLYYARAQNDPTLRGNVGMVCVPEKDIIGKVRTLAKD